MTSNQRFGHRHFDTTTVEARDTWWDGPTGNKDKIAAGIYATAAVLPLVVVAIGGPGNLLKPGWGRLATLLYGLAIALGPHVWLWAEASAFFDWSAVKYKDDATKLKESRDHFKVHADGVKAVWAGIIAAYAGVLLRFT